MDSIRLIKSFFFLFMTILFIGCDLFLNEQEFDPSPFCDIEFLTVSEQPPELIGGLVQFLQSVKYPEEAKGSGVEGRVTVQFLVLEDGTTTCVSVVRGIGRIFNQTAANAARKALFEPGRNAGFPVIVQYALPIHFSDPDLD